MYAVRHKQGVYTEFVEFNTLEGAVKFVRGRPVSEGWAVSRDKPTIKRPKLEKDARLECRFNAGLKKMAADRARSMGMSLSAYIESLVMSDLT